MNRFKLDYVLDYVLVLVLVIETPLNLQANLRAREPKSYSPFHFGTPWILLKTERVSLAQSR